MRILHLSDNHGLFYPLENSDIICHTGDLLPNKSYGTRCIEEKFQDNWVKLNLDRFKAWIGDRPFFYTAGNHDFIDPVPLLQSVGIDAFNVHDGFGMEYNGVTFAGFPWIKWFTGMWNREIDEIEIAERLTVLPPCDILMTHSPMYGVLDRNYDGERCGSTSLRDYMKKFKGKALLCGHIHESAGIQRWSNDILVSNAATTQKVINYHGSRATV